MNRRSAPLHRRKRKAEVSPSVEEDRESTEGPEEKKQKLDDREGQWSNRIECLRLWCCIIVLFLCIAEESVSPPSSEPGGSESVEIQIRPHPQHSELAEMAIKNLATSPLCTVSHLLRFIKLNTASAPEEAGKVLH